MRILRPVFLLPLLLTLAACEGNGSFTDEGVDAPDAAQPDTRYTIKSEGGEMVMGVTDTQVYYRLSDSLLQEIDREMARGTESTEGVGGALADAVTGSVSNMLRQRFAFDVADVQRIEYENGALQLVLEDGSREGAPIQNDGDQPVFPRAEAERLIAAFEEVKRAQR